MSDTGMSNWRVLLYTTLSGAVPQVSASVAGVFPVAAGFAAGAMMAGPPPRTATATSTPPLRRSSWGSRSWSPSISC